MNISPVPAYERMFHEPVPHSPEFLAIPTTSAPSAEDRFDDLLYRSNTNTPLTTAYTNTIQSPKTPIAERVVLGLMIPIMVPILAILDTLLYPVIKLGQFTDWVKDKLS